MNNNELNYLINELSNLQASEGWKIMLNHLNEQLSTVSEKLDEVNSEKNVIKYNEYDMDRHDKFIIKGMTQLVPNLIQEYMNQKTPDEDFKQV